MTARQIRDGAVWVVLAVAGVLCLATVMDRLAAHADCQCDGAGHIAEYTGPLNKVKWCVTICRHTRRGQS